MTVQGTPDWLAQRRQFVGASEVAALLGRDPFKGEWDVWTEKTGRSDGQPSSWPMSWGQRVQRLALEVYSEVTGRKVRNVTSTSTDPRWPHVRATPDGRVVGERRGVEVKWTSRSVHEPLEHWVVQVQVQMIICSLARVDIIRLSGRDEPAIWTVECDPHTGLALLGLAEAWYVRYVLGDEPPPVDGSRGASRYLDSQVGPPDMVASDEQAELVTTLRQIRKALDVFELDDKKLVNLLKASMAGAEALRGPGFRILWRQTKERQTVDWKAVAAEYKATLLAFQGAFVGGDMDLAAAALDKTELAHTTTGEGTRPFRVNFEEEEA